MRVLEVTQRFRPAIGGVEDHVGRLSRELRRAGIEVDVATSDLLRDRPFLRLASRSDADEPGVHRHAALPIAPLPHGLGIVAPGMVRETLASRADVVHAHAFGYPPTWAAALRHAFGRGPVVITPHSDEGGGGRLSASYGRVMARWTVGHADGVIALTEHERELLVRREVPRERIHVIPNGVDLPEFEHLGARAADSGGFRVLFVGRLYTAQKGLDTLMGALDLLGPPAELRLAGEDWGAGESITRWAESRREPSSVKLLGMISRSALLEEYRSADVLVLPSRFEPFGIVLLEAMAAGLPVVASRVGGIPEIVDDGRTGLLVPAGAPDRLADALRTLREDSALARRFGAEGRRRVERFSWARLGPRFVELFRELIEP